MASPGFSPTSPDVSTSREDVLHMQKQMAVNRKDQIAVDEGPDVLRRKLASGHSERMEVLDPEYEAAFRTHSQNLCFDFSQKICDQLPRGLRDKVYNYLVDDDKQRNIVSIEPTSTKLGVSYIVESTGYVNYHVQLPMSDSLPYYLSTEFMGTQLVVEIGQALYARLGFHVRHVDDLHSLLVDGPLGVPD
jgi:hypothetical protein